MAVFDNEVFVSELKQQQLMAAVRTETPEKALKAAKLFASVAKEEGAKKVKGH